MMFLFVLHTNSQYSYWKDCSMKSAYQISWNFQFVGDGHNSMHMGNAHRWKKSGPGTQQMFPRLLAIY